MSPLLNLTLRACYEYFETLCPFLTLKLADYIPLSAWNLLTFMQRHVFLGHTAKTGMDTGWKIPSLINLDDQQPL